MGFLELLKRSQKESLMLVQAKEAEKFLKMKEKDDKLKIEKYTEDGILYCPKCLATNLKTTKKKYKILNTGGEAMLTDFDGNVLGSVSSKNLDLVCACCGHKWNNKINKK